MRLAPVHRLVGPHEDLAGFLVGFIGDGHAAGDGSAEFRKADEFQLFDRLAKAFSQLPGARFIALGHENGKFLTPDATQGVAGTQFILDAVGGFLEDQIADMVSVAVIDLLEPVEINQYHGVARAVSFQALKFPSEDFGKAAAVGCSGQIIGG